MSIKNDVKHLQPCLTQIIELVKEYLQKLKFINEQSQIQPGTDVKQDPLLQNVLLNNNVHTFTLSNEENDLLDNLTSDIQTTLNRHLPHLTQSCQNYLFDFLHTYHYDSEKKQFASSLSLGDLHSFRRELKGLLASLEAFPAAYHGQLDVVKTFIKQHPAFKDRPGLWETTLLYSAARNDHLYIVKYLIEGAHCSVNAQNQCEVAFALDAYATDYTPQPRAGSTALHGACYNDHLDVVQYLVEHGANYFIRNQAHETPMMNCELRPAIKEYFQNYLVLGYTNETSKDLPDWPVMDDDRRPLRDCMWEYKPFQDSKWYRFSASEATELHKSLLPSKEFQKQVYLRVAKGLYSVSMIEFYRSARHEQDAQKNMAWVRCRGSSILNFDCYSVWQIMLIQHPKVSNKEDAIPSLKIQHFPTMRNSRFKLQLNTWYRCDAKTSSLIDDSMNYRRKVTFIKVPYVGDNLKFKLQTFEFSNREKTIFGYVRWIPKLIAKNGDNNKKIVPIDNYQPMTNIQPTPLTTKHSSNQDDDDDDDGLQIAMATEMVNDEGDDDDDNEKSNNKKQIGPNKSSTWSITDLSEDISTTTADTVVHKDSDISAEKFFHEKAGEHDQSVLIERNNSSLKDKKTADLMAKLQSEVQELKDQIEREKLKFEEQKQSEHKMTEEKEQQTNKLLEQLQQKLRSREIHEQKLKDLTKQIKSVDYDNVESILVRSFLMSKIRDITNHLKTKHHMDNYHPGIPTIMVTEKNDNYYCLSVTGVQAHHDEFKIVLRRTQTLSNVTKSAKDYYRRQLNATLRSTNYIMTQLIRSSQDWKHYTKCFQQLVKNKMDEFVKQFDGYISQKTREMSGKCIADASFQSWIELRRLTNEYMKNRSFTKKLEELKYEALEEYIKQHISSQQLKSEKIPSQKSILTMNEFIDKVKKEFKTNPIYVGCDVDHFKHIPKLLQRIMLYYRCFLLQLPLYESSHELLDKIEKNTVITIATSTGSGKSSLLPALLIAEGYEKVIVTQPRRLPCTAICERVNQTMTTNKDDFKLAGWAVSGAERDVKARILYLTDGLLKERLLHDENLISNQTNNNKPIVFFIDEVHERSINIDLCLALFARLLTEKPEIKSKIKIIISSATLDSSVPTLFRQIPQLKFDEFKMPTLGTLYPVAKFERPNENILDLVQELCKKRQIHDQILCFVNSVSEVNQCCKFLEEISNGTITAFPLIQSQSAVDQQTNIKKKSIFFSTTVAETSLTFPSLTYVIDTGMINIPVYDFDKKQTILKEVRAAESTIKQRLGRLGRTQQGEYYSLYDFKAEDKEYPTPQICQSELVNVEFSLRRSTIKNGLDYMKKFLPDSPNTQAITGAVEELKRLRILDSQDKLTSVGIEISKLPDFGSLAMSKSVLSALNQNNCGHDLIVLSSILGVLNTSSILKAIPSSMKSPEGDFMSLLNVMNEILSVKTNVRAVQIKLTEVCQAKNLIPIIHVLRQALRRYASLEKSFNLSDDYREKAQVASKNWELIAKSLLSGYGENVFVSMKELQGKTHLFTRYSPPKEDVAVLDLQSTLTRTISTPPVPLILARDIRFSSSIRATAVLSFVGEIKSQWIEYRFQRQIKLNTAEEAKINSDGILAAARQNFPNIKSELNNSTLTLSGSAGSVLDAELDILQQLVVKMPFTLTNVYEATAGAKYECMKRNLEGVSKMLHMFNPMIWRWEAQHQVKITVSTTNDECEVTIEGRDSQNQLVHKEFQSFLGWVKDSAVIRHPNAGVSPRILKPQMRKDHLDIEERISHITESKRTSIELWKGLKGPKATRETRMEVVAWIATCKFDCRLEGGFVRDWVVQNYYFHPATDPSTWVTVKTNKAGVTLPYLSKDLIPSDLDCHLPSHRYFDISKFLDNLHKYQIECEVFREDWRYILLLDKKTKTGPFTMDLIEPHVALTHDRIDFDVSNLSLEKDYTKELGMRVDIQHKPYSIDLEIIVDNIKNTRFQILRPIDITLQARIQKMQNRGWTQLGQPMHVIPNPPPKYHVVIVSLPESTELYKSLVQQMQSFINNQVQVLSIEQIKNPLLEEAYISMKQLISKQCKGQNPNERELFHGTKGEAIDGILNDGYDDRYWGEDFDKEKFGHGAYFANNPGVSHKYTAPDPNDQTLTMFYNKVVLGNESMLEELNLPLMSAPKGYHSIHGTFAGNPHADEYIVYRYGQALPYLKITYKA